MNRAYNFNAGPAALPLPVLEAVQAEFVNFKGTGMSIVEMSHRGKDYEAVHNHAKAMLYKLLSIPDDYEVLFLQGGASLQFAMVPMNFLTPGRTANYILTGSWSEKALKEAEKMGSTFVGGSSEYRSYSYIPDQDRIEIEPDHAYVHITSNNTIFGTQWHQFPDTKGVPLVADMSSDILSRPLDVSKFALIYAGAQKESRACRSYGSDYPPRLDGRGWRQEFPPCSNTRHMPVQIRCTILRRHLPSISWVKSWTGSTSLEVLRLFLPKTKPKPNFCMTLLMRVMASTRAMRRWIPAR